MAEIVDECTAELAALAAHPAVTRNPLVVLAGHSAGAHLAAMATLVRRSPLTVQRLVLVSGVFDLRPLVRTSVNAALGLDDRSAVALSPQLLPLVGEVPEIIIAWGEQDTDAFGRQSRAFAERAAAPALECRGRHHFDVVDDLADPASQLGAVTLRR